MTLGTPARDGRGARFRWPVAAVSLGAGVLVASLWLHRVEPESFEDFYSIYGGRLGIPDSIPSDTPLSGLPGWFFSVSAAGQVLFAFLAWRLAYTVRLRPDLAAADETFTFKCTTCALAMALWTLLTVVLFPGEIDTAGDSGPFDRLPGTWVAATATGIAAAGLLALSHGLREIRTQRERTPDEPGTS